MTLSMTSDYVTTKECPEPYLAQIAEGGFSHIHWCHHWCTDFLYSDFEIRQIAAWLDQFGLQLLDLHASTGQEKNWASTREYERLAGIELVANRIEMAARLSSDVIIMHIPGKRGVEADDNVLQTQLRKSLDFLQPLATKQNVRIAIENVPNDDFQEIRKLFSEYPSSYIGLCYDSGHGNIGGKGLEHLDSLKDRLISVHLHDNDGYKDQHNLLLTGTVNWPELARIIAESAYDKCVSMECNLRGLELQEEVFLKKAFETGTTFSNMINRKRNGAE